MKIWIPPSIFSPWIFRKLVPPQKAFVISVPTNCQGQLTAILWGEKSIYDFRLASNKVKYSKKDISDFTFTSTYFCVTIVIPPMPLKIFNSPLSLKIPKFLSHPESLVGKTLCQGTNNCPAYAGVRLIVSASQRRFYKDKKRSREFFVCFSWVSTSEHPSWIRGLNMVPPPWMY